MSVATFPELFYRLYCLSTSTSRINITTNFADTKAQQRLHFGQSLRHVCPAKLRMGMQHMHAIAAVAATTQPANFTFNACNLMVVATNYPDIYGLY